MSRTLKGAHLHPRGWLPCARRLRAGTWGGGRQLGLLGPSTLPSPAWQYSSLYVFLSSSPLRSIC